MKVAVHLFAAPVGGSAKALLLLLWWCWNPTRHEGPPFAFPSVEWLTRTLGQSRRATEKQLAQLSAAGLIRRGKKDVEMVLKWGWFLIEPDPPPVEIDGRTNRRVSANKSTDPNESTPEQIDAKTRTFVRTNPNKSTQKPVETFVHKRKKSNEEEEEERGALARPPHPPAKKQNPAPSKPERERAKTPGLIDGRWRHSLAAWNQNPSLVLDQERTEDGETFLTYWRTLFRELDGKSHRPRVRDVAEKALTHYLRRRTDGWSGEPNARAALLKLVHAWIQKEARHCVGGYERDKRMGLIGLTSGDLERNDAQREATENLIKSQRAKAAAVEGEHDPDFVRALLSQGPPASNVRRVAGSKGEAPAAEATMTMRWAD